MLQPQSAELEICRIHHQKLLSKFGIDIVDERIINDTTLRLNPDEVKLLYNNASYLIAMSVVDFANNNPIYQLFSLLYRC